MVKFGERNRKGKALCSKNTYKNLDINVDNIATSKLVKTKILC